MTVTVVVLANTPVDERTDEDEGKPETEGVAVALIENDAEADALDATELKTDAVEDKAEEVADPT